MTGAPAEALKLACNKKCADCEATIGPRWASVKLGTFICETCADLHRKIGTHVSVVKNVKSDEWKPEWVAIAKGVGNDRANDYYTANAPDGQRYFKPIPTNSKEKENKRLEEWIRDKYESKKFAPSGEDEPCKRVARGESLGGATIGPARASSKETKSKKHKHGERSDSVTASFGAFSSPDVPSDAPAKKDRHHKKRGGSKTSGHDAFGDTFGGAGADVFAASGWEVPAGGGGTAWGTPEASLMSGAGSWGAPVAAEMRVDPADGNAYSLDDFVLAYGGSRSAPPPQWASAIPLAAAPADGSRLQGKEGGFGIYSGGAMALEEAERRIDPVDGRAYTLDEFVEAYGGSREDPPPNWHQAASGMLSPHGTLGWGAALAPAAGPSALASPAGSAVGSAAFGPLAAAAELAAQAAAMERRIDPTDGNAYTLDEFVAVYGGSARTPPLHWYQAAPAVADPAAPPAAIGFSVPTTSPGASASGPPYVAEGGVSIGFGAGFAGAVASGGPSPAASVGFAAPASGFAGALAPSAGSAASASASVFAGRTPAPPNIAPSSAASSGGAFHAAGGFGGASAALAGAASPGIPPSSRRGRSETAVTSGGHPSGFGNFAPLGPPSTADFGGETGFAGAAPTPSFAHAGGGGCGFSPVAGFAGAATLAEWGPALEPRFAAPGSTGAFEGAPSISRVPSNKESLHSAGWSATADGLPLGASALASPSSRFRPVGFSEFVGDVVPNHLPVPIPSGGHHNPFDSGNLPPASPEGDMSKSGEFVAIDGLPQEYLQHDHSICDPRHEHGRDHSGSKSGQAASTHAAPLAAAELAPVFSAQVSDEIVVPLVKSAVGFEMQQLQEELRGLYSEMRELRNDYSSVQAAKEAAEVVSAERVAEVASLRSTVADLEQTLALSVTSALDDRLRTAEHDRMKQFESANAERAAEVARLRTAVADLRETLASTVTNLDEKFETAEHSREKQLESASAERVVELTSLRTTVADLQETLALTVTNVLDDKLRTAERGREEQLESAIAAALDAKLKGAGAEPDVSTIITPPAAALMDGARQASRGSPRLEATPRSRQGLVVLPLYDATSPARGGTETPRAAEPPNLSWVALPSQGEPQSMLAARATSGTISASRSPVTPRVPQTVPACERPAAPSPLLAPAAVDLSWAEEALDAVTPSRVAASWEEPPQAPPSSVLPAAVQPAAQQLGSPPAQHQRWEFAEGEAEKYYAMFVAMDTDGRGALGLSQAGVVLRRSGVPSEELAAIWEMCDVRGEDLLTPRGFLCALHLARRCKQGATLPPLLPAELLEACASAVGGMGHPPEARSRAEKGSARSAPLGVPELVWVVSEEQERKYRSIFLATDRSSEDALTCFEAKRLLMPCGLPEQELSRILSLADSDHDDLLAFEEFACALHLVSGRRRGWELPLQLPTELVSSLPGLPSSPDLVARRGGMQRPSGPLATDEQEDISGLPGGSWAISSEQLEQYRTVFCEEDASGVGFLRRRDAQEVLRRSELSDVILSGIWRLACPGGGSRVSAAEFACAMHLACAVREGAELPSILPDELSVSALGGAEAPASTGGAHSVLHLNELQHHMATCDVSAPGKAKIGSDDMRGGLERSFVTGDASFGSLPWTADAKELQRYRVAFDGLSHGKGRLTSDELTEVFELSGVPAEELNRVWLMSDLDGDDALTFAEFACAMHILAQRRKGRPLPEQTPQELLASL